MDLLTYSEKELRLAGLFDESSDYGGDIAKSVMELINLFNNQGHSGGSAPYVADIFKRLASFEPLTPITGSDAEWGEPKKTEDGQTYFQNSRCSALFKDEKNGRPYYIHGIVKRDQNGGYWSGRAWESEEDYKTGDREKMVGINTYVKSFPFVPKTFYIDVRDVEITKDDWESFVSDPSQLDEVRKYYDLI
jgi:hypothetical protein